MTSTERPESTPNSPGKNTNVDQKTVANSMLRPGLEGISPKKFTPVTTIVGVDTYRIHNWVTRGWEGGASTRCGLWTSPPCIPVSARSTSPQLTMLTPTGSSTGHIPGRQVAHTLRGEVPDGVVFHADRGIESTSHDMFRACRGLKMLQSVGQTDVCWSNAMAESVGDAEDRTLRPEQMAYSY